MVLDSEQRPWGAWHVIDVAEGYKIKRIHVTPGARLSLQSHEHRSSIGGHPGRPPARYGVSPSSDMASRSTCPGGQAPPRQPGIGLSPVGFETLKVEPTLPRTTREVGASRRPPQAGHDQRGPRAPGCEPATPPCDAGAGHIQLHRTRSAVRGSHGAPHLGVAGHAALPGEVRRPRRPALHERRDACLG